MNDKEIMYLALCNQVQAYNLILEDRDNMTVENIQMSEYIITRTLQMIDKLALELESQDTKIKRPLWEKPTPP